MSENKPECDEGLDCHRYHRYMCHITERAKCTWRDPKDKFHCRAYVKETAQQIRYHCDKFDHSRAPATEQVQAQTRERACNPAVTEQVKIKTRPVTVEHSYANVAGSVAGVITSQAVDEKPNVNANANANANKHVTNYKAPKQRRDTPADCETTPKQRKVSNSGRRNAPVRVDASKCDQIAPVHTDAPVRPEQHRKPQRTTAHADLKQSTGSVGSSPDQDSIEPAIKTVVKKVTLITEKDPDISMQIAITGCKGIYSNGRFLTDRKDNPEREYPALHYCTMPAICGLDYCETCNAFMTRLAAFNKEVRLSASANATISGNAIVQVKKPQFELIKIVPVYVQNGVIPAPDGKYEIKASFCTLNGLSSKCRAVYRFTNNYVSGISNTSAILCGKKIARDGKYYCEDCHVKLKEQYDKATHADNKIDDTQKAWLNGYYQHYIQPTFNAAFA